MNISPQDDAIIEDRIDKSLLGLRHLNENQNDLRYWLSITPQHRIAAIEMMRRINYGHDIFTRNI